MAVKNTNYSLILKNLQYNGVSPKSAPLTISEFEGNFAYLSDVGNQALDEIDLLKASDLQQNQKLSNLSSNGGTLTVQGDLFVDGSLLISGSSSTIDTTSLVVNDSIISIGYGQDNPGILDLGIMFSRGSVGLTQAIIWDRTENQFALIGTNDNHTKIGNVSIDGYSDLRVNKLVTSDIKISNGANQNYILISDSDGNASWTASIPGTSGTSGVSGTSGTSGAAGPRGETGSTAPSPSISLFNYYNFI